MQEKREERCAHCADIVAQYGERYHKVYPDDQGRPHCTHCGATLIDGQWVYVCKACGRQTDRLYGLFVPHKCLECHEALIAKQRRMGRVCGRCGQVWAECCC